MVRTRQERSRPGGVPGGRALAGRGALGQRLAARGVEDYLAPRPAARRAARRGRGRQRGSLGLVLVSLGAAGVVALAVLLAMGTPRAAAENPQSPRPSLGRPVADGQWEYTVLRAEVLRTSVGGSASAEDGSSVVISLRLRNLGPQAATATRWEFALLDEIGRSYAVSLVASQGYYARAALLDPFAVPVGPGLRVETALVFELPAGARPSQLLVRGAPFSGGQYIPLR